jgi:hypothetical protein
LIAGSSPYLISARIPLLVPAPGVIHVVTAVTTAKGPIMTTSTEQTKTTQGTGDGQEPKATQKARAEERRAHVAPAKGKSGKKATAAKKTPTSAKNANTASVSPEQGKPKKAQAAHGGRATARNGSKTAEILHLLRRENGATLAEIMKATGWQPHSVRGFLSGTVGKKMGLAVASTKGEGGERTYSIKS